MNIRLSYLLYYLYLLQLLPFYLLRKALSLNFSAFESLHPHCNINDLQLFTFKKTAKLYHL